MIRTRCPLSHTRVTRAHKGVVQLDARMQDDAGHRTHDVSLLERAAFKQTTGAQAEGPKAVYHMRTCHMPIHVWTVWTLDQWTWTMTKTKSLRVDLTSQLSNIAYMMHASC